VSVARVDNSGSAGSPDRSARAYETQNRSKASRYGAGYPLDDDDIVGDGVAVIEAFVGGADAVGLTGGLASPF
jgi:hypothetical protein